MSQPQTPRGVIVRDLLVFQIKLLIDGFKDLVLVQLSLVAAIFDVLLGGSRRGRIFYGLLRVCERFDLWINLYSGVRHAERSRDGLLGAPATGVDSLLTRLTELNQSGRASAGAHGPQLAESRTGG